MKFINLVLFASLFAFTACGSHPENSKTVATIDTTTRVEVIDFYGTHRCVTCKAIEANAKYTVDTYFKEEVENGVLLFKTVNVDDKDNYDIAESFETVGTALFINVVKDGQEQHIDLTNFAFDKGQDQEAFSAVLKEKINEQLKTL